MPDSFAAYSILFRLMPICTKVVTTENPTVTSTIRSDGITSPGAKRKICVTYKREVRLVSPVVITMFISMEQSCPTDMERLFSSPGLYCRKKLAGRDMIRIIMEACTPSEVFASSRLETMALTEEKSCTESDTQTRQTASPISAVPLPLKSTGPVSALVRRGISRPTPDTRIAARTSMRMSLTETQRFMYSRRSGMPSFFSGSGR